ncbi:magnesium chelatase subunit D [Nakamurella panacisegetis]|uniref:Mg-protoporphyrin IX chelatase n=1 Tax=Nakamurella panacisegetis TaxID=1090615 RepID=A0A1H0HZE9_9ACTN|nr:magnesium chelatase subunit D family protein [Nakamurella panacisegetis]SDO24529.1 magnesium chelatase subunit D [Nakamurella panacisegetis]
MRTYPFTAVVGSDDMALALALCAVSPAIGGVLVRGEKGTAKSTMVRALAALLPAVDVIAGCRFSCDPADPDPRCPDHAQHSAAAARRPARLVELPVGATEDRVIGSLHLEKALAAGITEYEPGLLAAAHRGLLYVDEVNLLHDHLVDLLLDAAAMGRSTVERDGVSVAHAARFVLVGTMNPEEGELRPQLLDRFGLTVEISAPRDPALRAEVIRRRLAFDADADAFSHRYQAAETEIADRIRLAQEAIGGVRLSDAALVKIAEVCSAFEVDGMRADIVTARTAVAHAAWHGRTTVTRADIRAAARLALPHRRRRNPFDAPGLDEELLDAILGDQEPDPPSPEQPDPTEPDPTEPDPTEPDADGNGPDLDGPADGSSEPRAESAGDDPLPDTTDDEPGKSRPDAAADPPPDARPQTPGAGPGTHRTATPGGAFRTRLFTVAGSGEGEAGKRSRAITSIGRTVGSTPLVRGAGGSVHLTATVRAAAPYQLGRGRVGAGLLLRHSDLRMAVKEGRESNLVLFCVDASGSMAARTRMEQVKTAVLSLLMDAYQRRDKVGLVTFRGHDAVLALPPTSSVEVAARRLADLPAGGRTPLAEGLLTARETLRLERIRDPRRRPLLVLVTDGRATSGPDALIRSRRAGALLAAEHVSSLVIDCETGRFRMGLAAALAQSLAAEYVPLGEVGAQALTAAVRDSRGRAA